MAASSLKEGLDWSTSRRSRGWRVESKIEGGPNVSQLISKHALSKPRPRPPFSKSRLVQFTGRSSDVI